VTSIVLAADTGATAGATSGEPARQSMPRRSRRAVVLACTWACAWPALLVASVYAWVGGTSLASPDDGFILAQSRRILAGQIPHRDFISPRPAGSALLHTVDFLLPLPLLQASRLVSAVEVVAYTLAFARLAYGRPLRRWSTVQIAGAAAAVFVNLHSFPLMAWHTIDGLFFVAIGLVVLQRGLQCDQRRWVYAGLLLLGCALVMKQSFAAAPLIGTAMVWKHQRDTRVRNLSIARALCMTAIPGAAYCAIVTLAGGLSAMFSQMINAQPTFGSSLVTILWRSRGATPILVACAAVICAIEARGGRTVAARSVASWTARAGLSALVLGVLLVTGTQPRGRTLLLILVVVVVWEWTSRRRADAFGGVMIAVAWMSALSWGYPTPRLVAGSIALVIVDRLWRRSPRLPTRWRRLVAPGVVVLAVGASAAVVATALHERAVLNAVGSSRDATLGQLVPDLRGLRVDTKTTELIREVATCRALYPEQSTAVLPGPAIVYPVMHLDNPFAVDWVYPLELHGSTNRLVQEARRLDQRGNYLVLVAPAVGEAQPIVKRLVAELHGQRDRCGGFVAIHST
jgi:hypothetical protein